MTGTKNNPKYVLLKSIEFRNRFFCLNSENDPTKLWNGKLAYEIIGYAETVEEAQFKLFGRSFTELGD